MKIKNLFSMLAMVGMLFATSCSQDDVLNGAAAGDYVDATFTISAADGMGTRAIGDGLTVDKVACAVYDEDVADGEEGVELTDLYVGDLPLNTTEIDGKDVKTATYNVRLAKGKKYRVAFFAYNEAADAYDVTDLKNVVVNDDQLSNVEGRDAFTAFVNIETGKTMNAFTETVTLKRPFAQLNLGIDDTELQDAANAGLVVAESKIVVSNVYSAFSAYSDAVVGSEDEMTFDLNSIPTEELIVDGVNYNYLALNYLLVGDNGSEKSLTDVEFVWKDNNGRFNNPTTKFLNVPVQRNYRTNILGKLLTSPAAFNIVIDSEFDGDKKDSRVFNAQDLQAAIDAAPVGETLIRFGADIVGDVTILQKEGVNLVIDGAEYKYDGVMTINGDARGDGNETLKIENINFATSKELTFIYAPSKINDKYNYSHNITIENCTFGMSQNTRSAEFNENIGSINLTGTYHLTVKGCKATGIHSLLQVQSCDNDVTVENLTVENCKNGISLGNVANASISNVNIDAAGYGIRLDGATERTVSAVISNSKISAFIPVNVRKMDNDACNVNVEIDENTTLTVAGGGKYDVAFCSNEYKEGTEPVKPKGTYNELPETYTVYPRDYYAPVASWEEFTAALAANEKKIILTENISNVESYSLMKDVVLDLNGKTFDINSAATNRLNIGNKNNSSAHKPTVTIKNGNFNGKLYAQTGNVTLSDITFGGNVAYAGDAQGVISVGAANFLAERCDMANVKASDANSRPRALSTEGNSSGYLRLIDCNFPSASDGTGLLVKTKLLRTYINPLSGNATLEIKNCKFGVAANIDLAASYVWTNMDLTGCSGGFTFTVSRSKDSLTEEETAIMKAIKKNNSGTIKAYYNGTSVTY